MTRMIVGSCHARRMKSALQSWTPIGSASMAQASGSQRHSLATSRNDALSPIELLPIGRTSSVQNSHPVITHHGKRARRARSPCPAPAAIPARSRRRPNGYGVGRCAARAAAVASNSNPKRCSVICPAGKHRLAAVLRRDDAKRARARGRRGGTMVHSTRLSVAKLDRSPAAPIIRPVPNRGNGGYRDGSG